MIGFTGPYSDVNFGDYAMLVNNIYQLGAHEAQVFGYDSGFLERIGRRYFGRLEVSIADVRLRPNLLASIPEGRFLTPLEVVEAVTNLDEIVDVVSRLDVLYVNGGGYFNSLWGQPHRLERLLKIVAPVVVAATQGKAVHFTANGYGPFRGDAEFFASLFGLLPTARFGMREDIMSPYWLGQCGVRPEQIQLLPDDLLFIDDRLARGGHRAIAERYVVLETYLPVTYLSEHVGEFERFVRRMRDAYGLGVVFLPFNLGHGGVDQGKFLADRIGSMELIDIESHGFLPIEDAVSVVRGAELVISSRYHAEILALSQGVPFVSVLRDVLGDKQYYHAKNVGALEGIVRGRAHDLRDYFFGDYVEALTAVGRDMLGIVERQEAVYSACFPQAGAALRAARQDFLGGSRCG